jgi:cadmium resistance protein CadD (predicted permease)
LGAEFHRVVAQKIVGFLDGLEKLIIVYERKTANINQIAVSVGQHIVIVSIVFVCLVFIFQYDNQFTA